MGIYTGYFNLVSVVDGDPGVDGDNGAKLRVRLFKEGEQYLSGAKGEYWYDVVYMLDNLKQRYLCVKTPGAPAKMGVNDPVTSIKNHLGYWVAAQEWAFVASDLALVRKIRADEIDADGITAKNVDVTGKITATSGSFTGEIYAEKGRIGGFTLADGKLDWKQYGYLGKDARSLKLGISTNYDEGIVDVQFNGATYGRFGIRAIGSNMGGAAIYASQNGTHKPNYNNSYAAFLDGGCHIEGHCYITDSCICKRYRVLQRIDTSGNYIYHEGVNWNKQSGSPDLDKIRLIVEGGIITGYYGE